jgi:polysaccharide export outer membrane protein
MKTHKYKYLLILIVALVSALSCAPRKEIVYFQTGTIDSLGLANKNFTPVFKTDDLLSIKILADDPESAALFNLPDGGGIRGINQGYLTGNAVISGYLVDKDGNINMPIIGQVNVLGLTRIEASEHIASLVRNYLKNPVVHIQIENFKITILGDVGRSGTYRIPNERITLIEAIGLAGDLRITGMRTNVLVIRDRNGVKTEYRVDLTSKEFLQSPVYYLEQNDVVYVEPNVTARSQASMWRSTGGFFISLSSLIITTVVLITR